VKPITVADVFALERQMTGLDCEVSADGESHKIVGIRQGVRFVEVIHAPDQATLGIPPCSEILDVQVSNRQDVWTFGQFRADQRPHLRPPMYVARTNGNTAANMWACLGECLSS
jgi:hypothetical protein